MKKFSLFAICHLLFATSLFAWLSTEDKGTSGAQFLKIGIGARPVALAGAYTSLSNDISGVYWNPAGVVFSENKEVELMYTQWFEDTTLNYFGIGTPFRGGKLFLNYTLLTVSKLERRTSDTGSSEGEFKAQDSAIGIGYAFKLGESAVGITLKSISSKIDDESASAVAVDIGWKKESEKYLWGISLRNLGTEIKFINEADPLPTNLNLGFGIKLKENMCLGIDLNFPRDNEINASIGYEYILKAGRMEIPLRVGYKTLNDFEAIDALSAGLGINIKSYTLDFAWAPYGDLEDTIRIALKGKF
ncbi:MAG: hypothetical protein DRI36_00710 [Caldiserica bacterium]|nr:MAG: hypothetical protein DRI36_00710 [Caldisericota bacterium]